MIMLETFEDLRLELESLEREIAESSNPIAYADILRRDELESVFVAIRHTIEA